MNPRGLIAAGAGLAGLGALAIATVPGWGRLPLPAIDSAAPRIGGSDRLIAITGGTLAVGDGSQPIADGVVLIRGGRVVAAGAGIVVPAGATMIDAHGKWVTPGIVAGNSSLGLLDSDGVENSNDLGARKTPFSAAIDVVPAINRRSNDIAIARSSGVTSAIVAPVAAGSIFAGQGAVITLAADAPAVLRPHAFQLVELGEDGAGLAGGSRPAAYALLREAFAAARDYRRNPAGFGGRERESIIKRGDAEALLAVLDGQVPLMVHVERASDIVAVLAMAHDNPGIRLIVAGASEGWLVAPQLAAAHVPVIAAALADLPESFERLAATESNVGRLTRAGVSTAISTIDVSAPAQQRNLTQFAGNLVALLHVPGATGLDWGQAFASISSLPARAVGLDAEIGSLRPGRRADVVIWDGDPLELASAPVAVYIGGIAQPLENRQSLLRDRYRTPAPDALPKAYRR